MQNKHVEKWELISMEARDVFSRSTPGVIKCTVGINHYRNRTRKIDKINKKVLFIARGEYEFWEHVVLCQKIKENREPCAEEDKKKLKRRRITQAGRRRRERNSSRNVGCH